MKEERRLAEAAIESYEKAMEVRRSYFEAALTLAELPTARAGHVDGSDCDGNEFEEAVQTPADARTLSGCMNRVDWTEAQARLARARFCAERGRDPAPDLERVFQLLDEEPARADSEPWQKVRAEAERMSGSAG